MSVLKRINHYLLDIAKSNEINELTNIQQQLEKIRDNELPLLGDDKRDNVTRVFYSTWLALSMRRNTLQKNDAMKLEELDELQEVLKLLSTAIDTNKKSLKELNTTLLSNKARLNELRQNIDSDKKYLDELNTDSKINLELNNALKHTTNDLIEKHLQEQSDIIEANKVIENKTPFLIKNIELSEEHYKHCKKVITDYETKKISYRNMDSPQQFINMIIHLKDQACYFIEEFDIDRLSLLQNEIIEFPDKIKRHIEEHQRFYEVIVSPGLLQGEGPKNLLSCMEKNLNGLRELALRSDNPLREFARLQGCSPGSLIIKMEELKPAIKKMEELNHVISAERKQLIAFIDGPLKAQHLTTLNKKNFFGHLWLGFVYLNVYLEHDYQGVISDIRKLRHSYKPLINSYKKNRISLQELTRRYKAISKMIGFYMAAQEDIDEVLLDYENYLLENSVQPQKSDNLKTIYQTIFNAHNTNKPVLKVEITDYWKHRKAKNRLNIIEEGLDDEKEDYQYFEHFFEFATALAPFNLIVSDYESIITSEAPQVFKQSNLPAPLKNIVANPKTILIILSSETSRREMQAALTMRGVVCDNIICIQSGRFQKWYADVKWDKDSLPPDFGCQQTLIHTLCEEIKNARIVGFCADDNLFRKTRKSEKIAAYPLILSPDYPASSDYDYFTIMEILANYSNGSLTFQALENKCRKALTQYLGQEWSEELQTKYFNTMTEIAQSCLAITGLARLNSSKLPKNFLEESTHAIEKIKKLFFFSSNYRVEVGNDLDTWLLSELHKLKIKIEEQTNNGGFMATFFSYGQYQENQKKAALLINDIDCLMIQLNPSMEDYLKNPAKTH